MLNSHLSSRTPACSQGLSEDSSRVSLIPWQMSPGENFPRTQAWVAPELLPCQPHPQARPFVYSEERPARRRRRGSWKQVHSEKQLQLCLICTAPSPSPPGWTLARHWLGWHAAWKAGLCPETQAQFRLKQPECAGLCSLTCSVARDRRNAGLLDPA